MLTYYSGEISVDKKYAKQLVEAFNTMTSLRETCEEEILNSNTDGRLLFILNTKRAETIRTLS